MSAAERAPLIDARGVVSRGPFRLEVPQLAVRAGETVAIVGPNGAGKTTLMETLLGMRKLRAGRVRLFGRASAPQLTRADKARLGVQLQRAQFVDAMRVCEIARLHREVYGQRAGAVVEALGIDKLWRKPYRKLSRGERQRIDIYLALAHQPELAVLDEPGTGMDASFHAALVELLRAGAARGSAAVFATHVGRELDVADRVVWIDAGQIREDARPRELIERALGRYRIELEVERADGLHALIERMRDRDPAVIVWRREGARALLYGRRRPRFDDDALASVVSLHLQPTTGDDLLAYIASEAP